MNPMAMMAIATVISGILSGATGSKAKQGSTYSKGAKSALDDALQAVKGMSGNSDITQNQNYQQGQDWLSGLFNDPKFFDKFEAPIMRQFEEETIPGLANRFAGMGSGGSLGSTAFQNQLAREGSNLHTNIAALRGNMQQQGVNQALQYGQQPTSNYMQLLGLATQPTQNQYTPASSGPFGPITGALGQATAQAAGTYYGNQMANSGAPSTGPTSGSISYGSRYPGQGSAVY